jgi:hypothetical protein
MIPSMVPSEGTAAWHCCRPCLPQCEGARCCRCCDTVAPFSTQRCPCNPDVANVLPSIGMRLEGLKGGGRPSYKFKKSLLCTPLTRSYLSGLLCIVTCLDLWHDSGFRLGTVTCKARAAASGTPSNRDKLTIPVTPTCAPCAVAVTNILEEACKLPVVKC